MALTDRLPPSFSGRGALAVREAAFATTPTAPDVLENFGLCLDQNLVPSDLFEAFCARLVELLPPDTTVPCDSGSIAGAIDDNRPFYCQGPPAQAEPDQRLSILMDVAAFLRARLGRAPRSAEVDTETKAWRQRRAANAVAQPYDDLALRTRRPFFWVTRSEALEPHLGTPAARLQQLLGMTHLQTHALEVTLTKAQLGALTRPTSLDALTGPRFYPAAGPHGWGLTWDLASPRFTPGLPEAVTVQVANVPCEVASRGDT